MEEESGIVSELVVEDVSFDDFGLDPRLVKATKRMGFRNPTYIQSSVIPLALEGKDVLANARTGSGKTVAYALPAVQRVLKAKEEMAGKNSNVCALILVPTKELCEQVRSVLVDLCAHCYKIVKIANVSAALADVQSVQSVGKRGANSDGSQIESVSRCDIAVGTPGSIVSALSSGMLYVEKRFHLFKTSDHRR